MRSIYVILLFLIHCGLLSAQNLNDLENEARGATGVTRVEKMLVAIDASLAQGDYNRAQKLADEANDFAKKINQPILRAKILNREGKTIMVSGGKKGLFGRERPGSKFSQSNDILKKAGAFKDPVFLDNLLQLSQLAQKAGKLEEVQQLNNQIAAVKNGTYTSDGPVTRQEMHQELNVLSQELAKQKNARDTTQRFAARMLAESEVLKNQLAEKEAAINMMTEGQVKVELMLMQQRQVLDSLLFRSRVDSLMLSNQNLALGEAQASRNFSFAIAAVLFLLCGGVLYSFLRARQNSRVLSEKNQIIETERQRSDRLLLNILPASVAEELKLKGVTNARYFENVAVLFADFVNFTAIAERITPQQLVTDLDTCFRAFDAIIDRYELEKIKTIGDAYLCAGGLQGDTGSAVRMVHAAREMQQWLTQWNTDRQQHGLPLYHARMGIHSGAVVAGVVGARKFAFDIWGDTVNIAARVEQAGEAGRINLSGAAYEAVRGQVACNFRGKIPVKNKGEIDMFFVE